MRKTAIIVAVFMSGMLCAAEQDPEPGTYYNYAQVGVREKEVEGTTLKLTFKPVDEQFYWCPGVQVKVTKKATILTFIRCQTSKDCTVDRKAAIGNRLIRTITIDTKGLDTYVFDGPKKYRRIYRAASSKPTDKDAGATNPRQQVIKNKHVVPGPEARDKT